MTAGWKTLRLRIVSSVIITYRVPAGARLYVILIFFLILTTAQQSGYHYSHFTEEADSERLNYLEVTHHRDVAQQGASKPTFSCFLQAISSPSPFPAPGTFLVPSGCLQNERPRATQGHSPSFVKEVPPLQVCDSD